MLGLCLSQHDQHTLHTSCGCTCSAGTRTLSLRTEMSRTLAASKITSVRNDVEVRQILQDEELPGEMASFVKVREPSMSAAASSSTHAPPSSAQGNGSLYQDWIDSGDGAKKLEEWRKMVSANTMQELKL